LVGLDLLAIFIPVAWPNNEVMHSHRLVFPVKAVAKRTSLLATVNLAGELLLFGYPDEQILPTESLGRLWGSGSYLADNDLLVGVDINAK